MPKYDFDFIEVVGWETYQHYKDRAPVWIKLYTSLLDSYDWSRLKDASKLLAVHIWLLAAKLDNRIPIDLPYMKSKMQISFEMENLKELESHGFIKLRYRDASKELASCEQDACLEKRREEEIRVDKRREERETFARLLADIVEAYHTTLPELPAVRELSDRRRKYLSARIEKLPTLEEWKIFWMRVKASDFLCGRSGKDFRADFEWCILPSNFLKILEGRYDNRISKTRPSGLDEWAIEQGLLPQGDEAHRNTLPKPSMD